MSRMKSLAQLHVWWPSLDTDIESHVKSCVNCAETAKDPTKVPLNQWDFPAKPWQRLHIDFVGPYRNKMLVLLIDAYSKWPEVRVMESTMTETVIKHLQKIFATHRIPHQIVSDMVPSSWQKNLSSSVCLVEFTTQRQFPITPARMARLKDWYKLLNRV